MSKKIIELDIPKNLNISLDKKTKKYLVLDNSQIQKSVYINNIFLKALYNHYYTKSNKSLKILTEITSNITKNLENNFFVELELIGLGYYVAQKDNVLKFDLGYSHSIEYKLPKNIYAKINNNLLVIYGTDKLKVSQVAANICKFKKINVYKGTGIKIKSKQIILKPGKKK